MRMLRRIIILLIFAGVLILVWWYFQRPTAPTCSDGIKNSQEEGVDCGVLACGFECPIELGSPQVVSTKLIPAGSRDYDFVAEIKNPHNDFGASEVSYELILLNGNQQEVLKKEGLFYILPGETKFLILSFLTAEKSISDIRFRIKSAVWQEVDVNDVQLTVARQKYNILPGGVSSFLEAVILNNSDFDFDTVEIDVILRNTRGEVIAVNKSVMNTLLAHTERGFTTTWPFPIVETVGKIEILPSTNLFENSNFIKRYGSGFERFQKY